MAVALLCAATAGPANAQQAVSVAGRVLDEAGRPVSAAIVTLRAGEGATLGAAFSDSLGRYVVSAAAGAGPLELRAERMGYRALTVTLSLEGGARQAVRDLVLRPQGVELQAVEVRAGHAASRPDDTPAPGASFNSALSFLTELRPLDPGDIGAAAAAQPRVLWLGGGEGAFPNVSISAQHPSQNGVTLDGARFGASTLPAEALRSTVLFTSAYDPALGQFSAGQFAATTQRGTNRPGGAFSLRGGHPALQAAGGGRGAAPAEESLLQADGGAGGALVTNRLFLFGAFQASRRSAGLVTLGAAPDALLQGLRVNPDSARRFGTLAARTGAAPAVPRTQATDAGSALLRLDYAASDAHALMLRLDGRTLLASGVGESPLSLAGSGGRLRTQGAGGMVQLVSAGPWLRNELRVYASGSWRGTAPYLRRPGVEVRVGTQDGGEVPATLRYGTDAFGGSAQSQRLVELSDQLTLRVGGAHQVKLGVAANRETAVHRADGNRYGSFHFSTLADLESGRASAFVRTLGSARRRAAAEYAGAWAAHLWRPAGGLSIVYGVRMEAVRHPAHGVADTVLGTRAGAPPADRGISPRAGFTWESRDHRWEVRGGAGEFRGRLPVPALAAGAPAAGPVLDLVCLGAAAPTPRWEAYTSSDEIPDACAGGGSVFASRTGTATLYGAGFGAPLTRQASLAWRWDAARGAFGMLGVQGEAALVYGARLPVALDANLRTAPWFQLQDEGGRPVYVAPGAIDPATGRSAPSESRVDPAFGVVPRVTGDGRSSTLQLTAGASLLTTGLDALFVNYTWTRSRDCAGPAAPPAAASEPLAGADPRRLWKGPADLERRHVVQLTWIRPLHLVSGQFSLVAQAASGAPFTPRADADVNGDGAANDPAFVFRPGRAGDPDLAAAMGRLMEEAPGRIRDCLRRQAGAMAARNGCRGPWTARLDAQADLWPAQEYLGRRFTVSVTAGNVMAGVDRLVNGRQTRGWGRSDPPDPVLLSVRGFDPAALAWRYTVNPRFGATTAGWSDGFRVTVQGRVTLGADPRRQPLADMIGAVRAQGRTAQQVRTELARTLPNLPAQVLAADSLFALRLLPAQKDRLAEAADSAGAALAGIADALAAAASTAETSSDRATAAEARRQVRTLSEQAEAALEGSLREVREILRPEQWERLPDAIRHPGRQLIPPRARAVNP